MVNSMGAKLKRLKRQNNIANVNLSALPCSPHPSATSNSAMHLNSGESHQNLCRISPSLPAYRRTMFSVALTLFVLLCDRQASQARPVQAWYLQIGNQNIDSNNKILIWPNEIEDNALTEMGGDFVYKQTLPNEKGGSGESVHLPLPPLPPPMNSDNSKDSNSGKSKSIFSWFTGKGGGSSQRNNSPQSSSRSTSTHSSSASGSPGRLSRNSAAAPAPAPGGSTVYLWPSFSPSSSAGSGNKACTPSSSISALVQCLSLLVPCLISAWMSRHL